MTAVASAALLATQLPAVAANGGGSLPPIGRGSAATTTTQPPATTTTTQPVTTTTTRPPATTTTTTTTTRPPVTTTTTTRPPTTTTQAAGATPGTSPTTTTTAPPPVTTGSNVATTSTTSTSTTSTTTTSTTTTTLPSLSLSGCKPDPAATIEALPAGGVFHGSGCYVTEGIVVRKPVTIDGGTYDDPVNLSDNGDTIYPIIRVKNTRDVTIENAVLNGENFAGGYHRQLVNEAGLDILSSDHVQIIDVATNNTFGDGMTLFSQFGVDTNPVTNLYVDGLTVTGAGRQGITMGFVWNSTLDNVHLVSSADAGWDFESDLPDVGSGNVTVNDAVNGVGVRFVEALQGPITFNDCQCTSYIHVINDAAASGQLVTFNGGSDEIPRRTVKGDEIAGIVVAGPGRLVMNHVDVTRRPGPFAPQGPAMSVTGGGTLTLVDTPLPPPVGKHDRHSKVIVEH
ncbi:MAG TPA: hypothetical protein VEJ44_01325 [Acidimicrobiales bacterium]|nr:hypothetical protein [Acidimicrobiales bacterium]